MSLLKNKRAINTTIAVVFTALIFWYMLRPIVDHWHDVSAHVMEISVLRFIVAAAMFAIFLFVFRALCWRKIIKEFGAALPVPAATRIWSTSELARYVPGSIMQVIGRAYLARPYGIDSATCSTSQVLELTIFLLANLMVALACLPWFAANIHGRPRMILFSAAALAPLLMLLLRQRVFYGAMNGLLKKLKRKPVEARVRGRVLLGILVWNAIGLCWQGLAIWFLAGQRQALDLDISRVGLVIGAYCLAWCAGFLAFWAPGGIGPRELVLGMTLRFALPPSVANHFANAQSLDGFVWFLVVLLRLWTIAGELMLASAAYLLDLKGALGMAGAAGRINSAPATTS